MQNPKQDKAILSTLSARERFSSRIILTLKLYSILGIVVAIIGSGYLVFELLSASLKKSEIFALTAAVAGLLMTVLSWALLLFRRELQERRSERRQEYLLVGRFIQAWAAFEETARSLVHQDHDDRPQSVRSVLEALKRKRLLDPTDFIQIEELLQLRNAIVHSGGYIPPEEIEAGYRSLLHYAERLSEDQPQLFVA